MDDRNPYRIAGGLQDNCNWAGPNRTFTKEGIRSSDWTMIRSRHHQGVMYLAGNRAFKLTARAEQFEVISPDLSCVREMGLGGTWTPMLKASPS